MTGLEEREAAEERGPSEVEKGRRVEGKKEQCFWARDEELSVIAPWALKVSAGKEWNTAVKRQIEDEYKPKDQAMIQTKFWSKDQSGYWKFHNGILPTHAPSGGALVAMSAEEHDVEEDEEGGQLKRGLRKRLQRAMREVVVSEVFSEPRVAPVAKELGLKQGSSIDLMNGFDLTQEKDRRRCWKRLSDEDPDLVVLCPPCGPFSALQNLNYPKMSFEKGMALLGEGVQHVEFAMRIYEWQVRRGKKAIFEHPATSKAWEEESVQRVLQLPEVVRIRGDQCEYGLRVGEDDQPAKKPTDFMVNGEGMARALSRRCQGNHTHVPLVNGKAKGAQRYPKELCEAMVKGFQEDWKGKLTAVVCFENEAEIEDGEGEGQADLEDELDQEVENAGRSHQERQARARPEDEEEEEKSEDEDEEKGVLPRGVTAADKRKIKKLHQNLGHPSQPDFIRALRMARARSEVIRYVKEEFRCDLCDAHQKPKAARPSTIPKHFEAGKVVGVDVVFMPSHDPRKTIPVLNVVDWATCYQCLEPLQDGTSAEKVWTAFLRSWTRTFGFPEIVVVDQGREFMAGFSQKLNESGTIVRTIGARSPWQQGRTERHGGLAKGTLMQMLDQVGPITQEEAAKNRLFNRSGYSPAQRQIGMNVRIPGSLGSDDPYDAALMRSTAGSEVQRMLQLRDAAMEAFLRHSSKEVVRRATKARPRLMRDFHPGEAVFVFRRPLPRRGAATARDYRKAVWCGPGTVIMEEGPNLWIAMRGEMWKCAKEQVRSATPEEEEAYGLLKDEFKELQQELARRGSKRGFKDISGWDVPGEEDEELVEEEKEEEPPKHRRRIEEGKPAEDEDEEGIEEGERSEPREESGSSSTSSSSSTTTKQDRPEAPIDETELDIATRSAVHNENLDGNPSAAYEPTRLKIEKMRFRPYGGDLWTIEDGEEPEEAAEGRDSWVYHEESHSIRRIHRVPRKSRFVPQEKRGCPISSKYLQSSFWWWKKMPDGSVEQKKDNWRKEDAEEGPRRFWTGFSEFKLKPGVSKEKINWSMLARKSSDEVKEWEITAEEWPKWRISDGDEWTKVAASGAVKPLDLEESEDVERQLAEAGSLQRILPSTMVRRWKPAELPGEPATMKSRWCIRGDRDPDILSLDRYAPTVVTAIISIALQVASSMNFRCAIGDLKNAFMQSGPFVRPEGRLFCKQPRGGLEGLKEGQIIEILAGAYGLGDAPAHWRKCLKRTLVELGYEQSAMDPCTFRFFHQGKVSGLVIVEVDDLLTLGDEIHFEKMKELQSRFKFGKFKYLEEEEQGVSFNGRRLRKQKDGTYLIDMQKFVEERMKEVPLEVGRAKEKEDEATESERNATRAAIGALTWAAKEGRPDCAASASIIASCLNKLKVQDILDLNKAIREAKKTASMTLRIQHIPLEKLVWGVITDASYANAEGGASQGAFGVFAAHEDLMEKGQGITNLLHWKSGKMHRIVNSTLAAESQSLSKGLSELAWSITIFNELTTENFDLRNWEQAVRKQRAMALAKVESDATLKKSLCVVDAKSLFDHLVKETVGTTDDRRTAIEMQVIRQAMMETGAVVKWVPHPKMFMDCLTKRSGNRQSLLELLDSGIFSLQDNEVKKIS